jgi:hypothetical protein
MDELIGLNPLVKPGLYHAQVSFVLPFHIEPADRCFLYIDHLGASYIGCLLIEHNIFCRQVVDLLLANRNRPIVEIGTSDVSHTL